MQIRLSWFMLKMLNSQLSPFANLDSHTCPLCKGSNACAIAITGNLDASCWCRECVIAPQTLDRLTKVELNKSCICVKCSGEAKE